MPPDHPFKPAPGQPSSGSPLAPVLGASLGRMAARPISTRHALRLAESLTVALDGRWLPDADVDTLAHLLQELVNAWSLSVSRFLVLQDTLRALLERAGADAAAIERVLSALDDLFLEEWPNTPPHAAVRAG